MHLRRLGLRWLSLLIVVTALASLCLPARSATAAETDGTCGRFLYVEQGRDSWPVFLPNGSKEPWLIDPFLFDLFQDGAQVTIYSPAFLENDWGPLGRYDNAKWLSAYSSVQSVRACPALDAIDDIAYSAKSDTASGIYLMNSAGGDIRYLSAISGWGLGMLLDQECPTWSPDGTEVAFYWITKPDVGDIYIVASDGSTLRNSTNSSNWYGHPDWSPDGSIFAYEIPMFRMRVVPVDSSSSTVVAGGPGTDEASPDWSPSGEFLAFSEARWDKDSTSPPFDLYRMRPDGTGLVSLTDNAWRDIQPAWSPDGSRFAFASNRDGDYEIFTMSADGTDIQQLTNNAAKDDHPTWSADGSRIAFTSDRDGNSEIYVMNADGSTELNVTHTPYDEYCPDWNWAGRAEVVWMFLPLVRAISPGP